MIFSIYLIKRVFVMAYASARGRVQSRSALEEET